MRSMRRTPINLLMRALLFSHPHSTVVPDYPYFLSPLHLIWHNQAFFHHIWGEIGNELGRKNITKNHLKDV
jgi:hypothetical protein